ncbi:hypothetical protein ACFV4K_28590 [Nocardia sp. NPDC059764]|uniref:hypothetical protein n=1 Tax=Nocardia sp. NPDC059764 TaxID=3346939 RepID=UPI003660DC5C
MTTIMRGAAITAASLMAAISLSTGTANAGTLTIETITGSPDGFGCRLTTETCLVSAWHLADTTTPVIFTVDGTALDTPPINTGGLCGCTYKTPWTPQNAGTYTLTATQGTQTSSMTVTILDYNSPEGVKMRTPAPFGSS